LAQYLVGQRAVHDRNLDHLALRLLEALADRLRHLVGLAERDTHVARLVAHRDECREAEATATLHDLRHAVHEDHALGELRLAATATTAIAARSIAARPVTAA